MTLILTWACNGWVGSPKVCRVRLHWSVVVSLVSSETGQCAAYLKVEVVWELVLIRDSILKFSCQRKLALAYCCLLRFTRSDLATLESKFFPRKRIGAISMKRTPCFLWSRLSASWSGASQVCQRGINAAGSQSCAPHACWPFTAAFELQQAMIRSASDCLWPCVFASHSHLLVSTSLTSRYRSVKQMRSWFHKIPLGNQTRQLTEHAPPSLSPSRIRDEPWPPGSEGGFPSPLRTLDESKRVQLYGIMGLISS